MSVLELKNKEEIAADLRIRLRRIGELRKQILQEQLQVRRLDAYLSQGLTRGQADAMLFKEVIIGGTTDE